MLLNCLVVSVTMCCNKLLLGIFFSHDQYDLESYNIFFIFKKKKCIKILQFEMEMPHRNFI